MVMASVFEEKLPVQITEEIERFCDRIAPGRKPVYVPVRPAAGARVSRCHVNVEGHVRVHGGGPVYGWIVWQSAALLHAEFHSNWLSPAGEMIDITPKADGEDRVLFLPDSNGWWEGRLVPSRRQARRDDPLLARLLTAFVDRDRIRAKYRVGEPASWLDIARHGRLQLEIARLMGAVAASWGRSRQDRTNAGRRAKRRAERRQRKEQRRRRR
jgi:hypothetical protein